MNRRALLAVFAAALTISASGPVQAAQDLWSWLFSFKRTKEIEAVTDTKYNTECGSCHFAYQPGWLPERSWRKLMTAEALADHFGQNAELDEAERKQLLNVLVTHAADSSYYKRSRKIMSTLAENETPLRITEVAYIQVKHNRIPKDIFKNDRIKGPAFCDKCHTGASKGNFDDDGVVIPGRGTWTW